MDEILKFLQSIDDGKIHKLQDSYDLNDEKLMMVMKLHKEGLIDINTGYVNGSPGITGYYLSDKGRQFLKNHKHPYWENTKKFFR